MGTNIQQVRKFSCPSCGTKLPLGELFIFKAKHHPKCKHCKANLRPIYPPIRDMGYILIAVGVFLPAFISVFFVDKIWYIFIVGILAGLITFIYYIAVLYLYTEYRRVK